MLEKPKDGWTKITIGGWSEWCSYVCDPHTILLSMFRNLLLYCHTAAGEFDSEDREYTIRIDAPPPYDRCAVCVETTPEQIGDPFVITFMISFGDVIKELVHDIRTNIDDWSEWGTDSYQRDPSLVESVKQSLLTYCNDIEMLAKCEGII